jgi:hypothetical protein
MEEEEILEKYGNVKMKFSTMFKGLFTYIGVSDDGIEIYADYYRDESDLYNYYLDVDEENTLEDLCADTCILTKDGKELGGWGWDNGHIK